MTNHSTVRMAGRHLDPAEGVMQPGHVVTKTDISALNTVLHYVAQETAPRKATAEISVLLTAEELLLLRQRLSDGPGTPAVNSVLDAKLYEAQRNPGCLTSR